MLKIERASEKRELRQEEIHCDLTVIGGGLAGVCAAITAAREGLQVTLVQDRPVLGGNASSEVRLWALGATSHKGNNNRWSREGGVIDEILLENLYRNPEGNPVIFDTVILDKVVQESNIRLLLNAAVFDVAMYDAQSIRSVTAFCSQNSTVYQISAPLFCDASGDGVVGYLAGAEFRMGAETREEFGERMAPSAEYGALLGHSIFFYSKDTGKPVKFTPPSYALKDITKIPRYRSFKKNEHGCQLWWIEYGGRLDTVHDSEKIKWELWKIVYGVWNYIKNSGDFPGTETLTLEWVGTIPGKRESRRFVGDYMLIQQDIVEQRKHYDAVSYGGWAIDLHPADGVYSSNPGCNQWHSKGVYQIPYRCMYSKSIRNLFLAGRILSASHVANGSMRVMMTCGHNAQAVGMAAVLCIQGKYLPRDFAHPDRIGRLQQELLKRGQYIPGLKLSDPNDLAQQAAIAVSSELKLSELKGNGELLRLDDAWAMLVPAGAGAVFSPTFELFTEKETDLTVELRISTRKGNFTPDVLLETKTIHIEPKGCSPSLITLKKQLELYTETNGSLSLEQDFSSPHTSTGKTGMLQKISVQFETQLDQAQYVFMCLRDNPDIYIRRSQQHVTGLMAVASRGSYRVSNGHVQKPDHDIGVDALEFWIPERWPNNHLFAMKFEPALDVFKSTNLTNGYSRPVTGVNAWVADFDDRNPFLTLSWNRPKVIRRIELAFDTDYDHPLESVLMGHPFNIVPYCVRQYRILDALGRVIYRCNENYQTRNVITFDTPVTTDFLKIELSSPDKNIPAALFEIRCYE